MSGNKPHAATQQFLDLQEIRDGAVVMKDGSLRLVISVASTNFALKSRQEQEAMVYGFQGFLNSLDFPIQVVIQSRRLDIDSYLAKMREVERAQTNELLRIQTGEYIEFVQRLVEFASIMKKDFYIVVPQVAQQAKEGLLAGFAKIFTPSKVIQNKREQFDTARSKLLLRADQIMAGLRGLGLRTVMLNTQEIIELLYNTYNQDVAEKQSLPPIEELDLDTGGRTAEASSLEDQIIRR